MSNLTKLEFMALDITGKNYLSWVLDVEIHLDAKGLGETIKKGNKATTQDKSKDMIFLHHQLYEGLKTKYLTVKDLQILWINLKEIITSQLNLCGEKIADAEMLEKTHSTFYANNIIPQTQYREKGFKKYSELISCLLVAEQNNELLTKNHELHPTSSASFPEANVTTKNGQELKETNHGNDNGNGSGCGHGCGYSHGCGRGYRYGQGGHFRNSYSHWKWDSKNESKYEKEKENNVTNKCYRCGGKGHWSRLCRTQKHLVDLY
ncbi:uncharacterized protein LOC120116079 [Hibiscus syriacus]|uniref:uncharacterized protein LOC120116079 n=1 Tax=Hibiscus syriacus TaxID=106335 RepID=UPI00192306A5|nr:uncharacterized protein LOC120116079 [Hibiscus syriacus]